MAGEQLSGISLGAQIVGPPTGPALAAQFPAHVLFTDTVAGDHTYTVPGPGDYYIELKGGDASGAGGVVTTATTGVGGGGGGGAGAYAAGLFTFAGGEVIAYHVGAAGNTTIPNTDGNDGADSTCDGGMVADGGKKGLKNGTGGAGGLASASSGDVVLDGGSGANSPGDFIGGGGGGAPSHLGAGINATTQLAAPTPPLATGLGNGGDPGDLNGKAGGARFGGGGGGAAGQFDQGFGGAGGKGYFRIWCPPPPWAGGV